MNDLEKNKQTVVAFYETMFNQARPVRASLLRKPMLGAGRNAADSST